MNNRARLISAVLLLMAALASAQSSGVSVNILNPAPNTTISDTLRVEARVTSTYELSFVRAKFGSYTLNLAFGGTWTNVFDTTSLSRGSYTLTVLAQDVFGNTGQVDRVVRVDRPPVLNVALPINGTVARSNLYVSVAASDDDPAGVRIDGYNGAALLFTGTNSVERFIPAFAGLLRFEATDSENQKAIVQRTTYVETSTNLIEAISAPGPLLDFSGSRLLYASIPDAPQPPTAEFLDSSSGSKVSAPPFWTPYPVPGEYYKPVTGWVSAASAVVVYDTPHVPEYTLALQGTNFFVVAYGKSPEKVVNGVAIIGAGLYDLGQSTNGCSVYLGYCSDCGGADSFRDLGATDIVLADTNGVFRSRPTDPTNICSRIVTLLSPKGLARNPVTDGTNVIFRWNTNIVANINGHDEVLATWASSANMQYTSSGGWIAFTKPGTMNQQQIWTRSPTGELEQRTFFSISSYLESLNSDGSVIFQIYNAGGPPIGRYLSLPGAQPVRINSGQGRVKWEAENLYVIIGRSAFRLSMGELRIHMANAQAIRLELRAPNGSRYSIQESSDLFNWSHRVTITNITGGCSLTNAVPNSRSIFYRAVLLP